jgi:hypothetical protein
MGRRLMGSHAFAVSMRRVRVGHVYVRMCTRDASPR